MKKIWAGLELQEREIKSFSVGSPKGAEEPGQRAFRSPFHVALRRIWL
jgi:hypothetical protein